MKIIPSTATVAQRPRHRRLAALAAAKSICDINQPPKMSPEGLAPAGMVMARMSGSLSGGLGKSGIGRHEINHRLQRRKERRPTSGRRFRAIPVCDNRLPKYPLENLIRVTVEDVANFCRPPPGCIRQDRRRWRRNTADRSTGALLVCSCQLLPPPSPRRRKRSPRTHF